MKHSTLQSMFRATCVGLLLSVMLAMPATADPDRLLDQVLEASGLSRQLDGSAEAFAAGLTMQVRVQADSPIGMEIQRIAAERLAVPALVAAIRSQLVGRFDEHQLERLLAWHESDLGRAVTQLEIEASTPAGQNRMAASMDSVRSDPELTERGRRLDQVLGMSAYTVQIFRASQQAIGSGLLEGSGRATEALRSQLQAAMDDSLEQVADQIESQAVAALAFMYRDLSPAQFEAYMTWVQSADGRTFNDALKDAMVDVLADTHGLLGTDVGVALRNHAPSAD